MRIILFGSNGQLGRSIVDLLKSEKNEFILKALSRKDLNINNFNFVKKEIELFKPDILINCSAYTNVDQAELNKEIAYQTNFLSVKNIAKICCNSDITFIHFSTDYIFDGNASESYCENDIAKPLNFYGQSKLEGENAIKNYCKKFIIIRTSWVFSEFGNNFFKTMLNLRKTKKIIKVVDDQVGCPTYTGDIAEAVKIILDHISIDNFKSGVYHFSSNHETTWYEFAKYIFQKADDLDSRKCIDLAPIKTKDFDSIATRPKYSVLRNSKIFNDFGIYSKDWRSSVDKVLMLYFKKHD